MRSRKALLCLAVLLLTWKVVRTDWIVEAPYWYGGDHHTAASITTESIVPPISPLWHPPQPDQLDSSAHEWAQFFSGGGNAGITAAPRLRPNWVLIILKLVGAFIVTAPPLLLVSYLARRLTFGSVRRVRFPLL